MNGPDVASSAPKLFAAVAGLGVLVLLLAVAAGMIVLMRQSRPKRFHCPFLRCDVEAKFEEWGGARHAVLRCSAFGRAEDFDCGTPCVSSATADIAPQSVA